MEKISGKGVETFIMADLGALNSYVFTTQQTQSSTIKNSADSQQHTIEILLGGDTNTIAPSDFIGNYVNILL